MPNEDLPFLDITAPGFSTRSREVVKARDQSWCARTPLGLAVLRHDQAGRLLRDRRLRQGSYAWPDNRHLEGSFAEFWKRSVIGIEGPPHKAARRIAQVALSNDYVLSLCPRFEANASSLLNPLLGAPRIEFISQFSEPFAGRAISALLALSDSDAAWIARDASTLGLAMGMDAKRFETQVNAACSRLADLADNLIETAIQGSYVARLVEAARESGGTDRQVLIDLIVISIFGGVDTTRAQLGFAMALFADHPDQWEWLRANPDHVPKAIEEVIRNRPTTTWSTREALEDIELDGVRIRAGETLHIFVHATATDPLVSESAGFDITVPRKIHFGFGGGAHHCLGQFVARTDMACALRVLLSKVARIEYAGSPEWLPDSGNTSPATLPLHLVPA